MPAQFNFSQDEERAVMELWMYNKPISFVARNHNLSIGTMELVLARKQIIWQDNLGLWKNNLSGAFSPGPPRLGPTIGTASGRGGHKRAGGVLWSQADLDFWVESVIANHSTVAQIIKNNPICRITLVKALNKKGYKFQGRKIGWSNV